MNPRNFTFQDAMVQNATLYADRAAFMFEGQGVTHAEYARRAGKLAAGLASRGVGQGDRVAVVAGNCLEYADLFGAIAWLGAIVVPVNFRLSASEVGHILQDTSPRLVVASTAHRSLVPSSLVDGKAAVLIGSGGDGWTTLGDLYLESLAEPVALSGDSPFMIIHTAAVFGAPRGAVLSHAGLMLTSLQSRLAWGLDPSDVYLGVLPLFHVGGIGFMLATLLAGGSTMLLPRFDPGALVRDVDIGRGSIIGVFPPMLGMLLDAAHGQGSELRHLRVVTGIEAGDTIARLHQLCHGATFWSAYGQTETSGSVCLSPARDRPGSAGRPLGLNAVAIAGDGEAPLATGEVGEIIVRGPSVFHGYWGFDSDPLGPHSDGWHRTGDIGCFDEDGYLWYKGRTPQKQLIKSGGENIYPAEIENAIRAHPSVAEVVVIGVSDDRWGESVKAICELKRGASLNDEQLTEFLGKRLARYKLPRQLVFVDELPRGAAGLPDREAVAVVHSSPSDVDSPKQSAAMCKSSPN